MTASEDQAATVSLLLRKPTALRNSNAKVTERIRLVSPNDLDYQATIDDPETFTQPFTLSARQRRQGAGGQGGGGGNAVRDPYAAESWEHACHEGNGEHEDEIKRLGFKWYFPPTPPKK